ncbi:MAG: fused MFS/spermidine synthase [Spirochaetaceae bacterium]
MRSVSHALPFRAAVIVMGMSGLVAQMSLLQEFLIFAAGNEMTIGLILANWLVIEAAGAAIGGRLTEHARGGKALFALINGLFCLSLPAALYGVRLLKPVLDLSVGEIPGLGAVFLSSFLLLLPTSITHGALFPAAFGSAPDAGRFRDSAIGHLYLLDTVGTLLGGLVWTWLLVPRFHSFAIATGVAALNGGVCSALLFSGGSPRAGRGGIELVAASFSVVVLLGAGAMFATGGAEALHRESIARQWRGQNVVEYRNSVHGSIAVVENEGQYSFFTDGTPALITPFPDTVHVKTYAHIPLTVHPDPGRVLLIGGGPGGLIYEMLAHRGVGRIDYAELDPLLVESLRRHSTALTDAELEAPRVSVMRTDGRSHLMRTRERYDVIVSMLSDPSDLQTNRFFTDEFFRLARRRLAPDGILVVRLPGLVGFSDQTLTDLAASHYRSLAAVFRYVRVFPGEEDTMAIASAAAGVTDYDVETLRSRLEARGLLSGVAPSWKMERILHPGWQDWFSDLVDRGDVRRNRDFAPYGVFQSLLYWSSLHAPEVLPLLRALGRIRAWMVAGVLLLATIAAVVLRVLGGTGRDAGASLCVFATGAAGMLFSLSLIFSFQSLFGYLFSWIGLLTAVFMAGSAAGALFMIRHLARGPDVRRAMVFSELSVLAAAALLPVVVPPLAPLLARTGAFALLRSLFLLLPFLCGMLTGAQFPLAARLREEQAAAGGGVNTAGALYAADLAGGWLGGMLGGVFLLPVLGLAGTGLSVALLKLLTLSHLGASLILRSKRA